MEAGVAAMIADLLLDMAASVRKEKNALLTLMMPGAFLACFLFQIDAVLVILACAGICLAYGFLTPHLKKA
jgi:chromate transporter